MKISELKADDKNANKGNPRGRKTITESLRRFGAGRSILIDRDGRIIAGNKTAENAQTAGLEDVIVVQSDGSKLIAVQRTDLSLDDPETRALAIADNRTAELGLEWDTANLAELVSNEEMTMLPFFTPAEMDDVLGREAPEPENVDEAWQGMPDCDNKNVIVRSITVHFADAADVSAFAKLMEQKISDKTKYLWYPEVKPLPEKAQKYIVSTDKE